MTLKIYCSVIINTNKQEVAGRLFEEFRLNYIRRAIHDLRVDSYWKNTAKSKAEFVMEFEIKEKENPIELFLSFISKISSNWEFILPSDSGASNMEISCISDKLSQKGIEWINFESVQV